MNSRVERKPVDLSPFPDLVVIYLGMRVNAWSGVKTLVGLGPQIKNSVDQKPDGLLLHENFIMSLIPLHLGMRQYWRDFDALEAWARSTPHREWWRDFLRSSRGTGFWHEAYFMRGGMEAVYDDVPVRLGFGQFVLVRAENIGPRAGWIGAKKGERDPARLRAAGLAAFRHNKDAAY